MNITEMTTPKTILFANEPKLAVSCVVGNAGLSAGADGKKILKAGTPLYGDLAARTSAFVKSTITDTGVKGVFTVQITTAAAAGDKIKIEGVDYECAAAEDVAAKKFAGANAAAQVTSLLKMVVCDDFNVAAVSGATDKIGFTQKVALTSHAPTVVVTQAEEAGAMVIGNVTETTTADTGTQTSNAVGVMLHDVDVTAGNKNAQVLIFGFVNKAKVSDVVAAADIAALSGKITFIE